VKSLSPVRGEKFIASEQLLASEEAYNRWRLYRIVRSYTDSFHLPTWNNSLSRRSSLTLTHNALGNAPSLPGLGGGRAHGMRYDDPGGSPKGHWPEGIPAVVMETQAAEQIEEESIGGDSEVEVLEPLEGHNCTVESMNL